MSRGWRAQPAHRVLPRRVAAGAPRTARGPGARRASRKAATRRDERDDDHAAAAVRPAPHASRGLWRGPLRSANPHCRITYTSARKSTSQKTREIWNCTASDIPAATSGSVTRNSATSARGAPHERAHPRRSRLAARGPRRCAHQSRPRNPRFAAHAHTGHCVANSESLLATAWSHVVVHRGQRPAERPGGDGRRPGRRPRRRAAGDRRAVAAARRGRPARRPRAPRTRARS